MNIEEDNIDKYNILREDLLIVYNISLPLYINHYPEPKENKKQTWASKRRDKLISQLSENIARKNWWHCMSIMVPGSIVVISACIGLAILFHNFIISAEMGILCWLLPKLFWLKLTDRFETDSYYIYNHHIKNYRNKKHGNNKRKITKFRP